MKKKKVLMIFGLILILAIFFAPTVVAGTTTYTEGFEDDTVGSNPSSTWYSYQERGFEYANVQNDQKHGGSQSFRINDSNGGDPTNTSWFNWTANSYNYVEFWVRANNSDNNDTRIYLYDGSNAWGRVDLITDVNDKSWIHIRNGTGQVDVNQTLTNSTWYRVRFDFNYTSDYVYARLYNGSTLENATWMDAGGSRDSVDFLSIGGYNDKKTYIWFDDLTISITTPYSSNPALNTIVALLPLLLAVGLILTFTGIATTGNLNKESMVALMMLGIIGIIVIQIISSLVV